MNQYLYTYDANNNQLSNLWQSWNRFDSTWTNMYLQTFTYDTNNLMKSRTDKDYATSTTIKPVDGDSTVYYYHIGITGIKQIVNNNVQLNIYPNPNNGSFVIEPSIATKQTMQVYDVSGKVVLSQILNGKTTIDASSFSGGIYNVSIISNEGVINKRLVIVR